MTEVRGPKAIERFNEIVRTTNTSDFEAQFFDLASQTLLVIGSFDLAFYHEVEALFEGVTFTRFDFGAVFCEPQLFIGDSDSRELAAQYTDLETDDVVFIIHNGPSFQGGRQHIVVAKSLTLREGMVYHYQRENLQPGESIAPWVPSSS